MEHSMGNKSFVLYVQHKIQISLGRLQWIHKILHLSSRPILDKTELSFLVMNISLLFLSMLS